MQARQRGVGEVLTRGFDNGTRKGLEEGHYKLSNVPNKPTNPSNNRDSVRKMARHSGLTKFEESKPRPGHDTFYVCRFLALRSDSA